MSTTDMIASLALAVSVAAAVGPIGAWRAARHSHQAAAILSRIEEDRPHFDLTPVFRYQVVVNEGRSTGMLRLHLDGPPGLEPRGPIEVSVSIRNDNPWRGTAPQLAGGPLEIPVTVDGSA
ncbi:hypothetical protein ACFWHQ_19955 [Streptomyces sp. NPDC060334]|uniref:hypothetical protein n=1 Tax=Streptomyces sp. NPDC060334 TaxID=3347099 RepID=UPI00365850DC